MDIGEGGMRHLDEEYIEAYLINLQPSGSSKLFQNKNFKHRVLEWQ
jgi:hypothetical protein